MERIYARHLISEATLFQYNMPIMLLENGDQTYLRQVRPMHASPGVSWRDIVNELRKKANIHSDFYYRSPEEYHLFLETVTISCEIGFASLSVQAAVNEIRRLNDSEKDDWDVYKRLEHFAKEMVASRDYAEAGGYKLGYKGMKLKWFWPKD